MDTMDFEKSIKLDHLEEVKVVLRGCLMSASSVVIRQPTLAKLNWHCLFGG